MTQLTRFDPVVLNRALIGFDRVFDELERRFSNSVNNNYPPHNIFRTGENHYEIQIAVTGFEKDEISVQVEGDEITVKGESRATEDNAEKEYLHRGLALRDFDRVFKMAEHMKVVNAEIKNGILTIKIEREIPEELKPRLIDIVEIK